MSMTDQNGETTIYAYGDAERLEDSAIAPKRPHPSHTEGRGTQRRGLNASEAGELVSFCYVVVKATTETERVGHPPNMQSDLLRLNSSETGIRNQNPGLAGVSGWLLLFCIEFAARIGAQMTLSVVIFGLWHYFSAVALFLAALSFLTSVSVWRITSRALLFSKTLLIVVFCVGIFGLGLEIVSARTFLHGTEFDFIVEAAMWFLYFKKSKRVRATFGRSI